MADAPKPSDQPITPILPAPQVVIAADLILANTREAARLLGLSRSSFDRLRKTGRLGPSPLRLGRRLLWQVAELRTWAAAGAPPRDRWMVADAGRAEERARG
jgi:predicted DNA-binding transcriptional regulator AlpA